MIRIIVFSQRDHVNPSHLRCGQALAPPSRQKALGRLVVPLIEQRLERLKDTASQFCSCASEGDAGPDISGTWEAPDSIWRLTIRRQCDDTLATVSRPSGELGPLAGRSDGLTFMLHYFDGVRAAVLEIERRKDGGLD